jgi:hypothetical protein
MAEYNIHCHVTREKSFVPTNCFNQAFSGFIAIQIAYRIAQTDLIDSIESTVHIISISAQQKYHGVEIKGVGKHWSQRQDRFVPWLVAKNLTGASCHCFVSRLSILMTRLLIAVRPFEPWVESIAKKNPGSMIFGLFAARLFDATSCQTTRL